MSILSYLGRLAREITNPPLFIYHLLHYTNRNIPGFLARYIKNRNFSQYKKQNIGDIMIPTIDGSYQIVHPDIDIINDYFAFIGTPYPYAMEEYENPCLYLGHSLKSLEMVCCPLDVQHERTQGVHLSDPCVASDGNKLYCVYRDTRYKDDYLYVKIAEFNALNKLNISDRILLLEKKSEYALSPAVILHNDSFLMYHVETSRVKSKLVLNIFEKENLVQREQKKTLLNNEPEGFYLWHIAIASSNDYGKLLRNDKLEGLFLYVSKMDRYTTKLCRATSQDFINWYVGDEVYIPENLKRIMKFPYKSCFIPNTNNVLLSFRDKKGRNRLIQIAINL